MKWEKIAGTPVTNSVQMSPIPGTRTIPRLGPSVRIHFIETLFCKSKRYFLLVPQCHTYMTTMKTKESTKGAQPPWGTFISEEERQTASILPKNKRSNSEKMMFFCHTSTMTRAINHVVTNMTVMHAIPEIIKSVDLISFSHTSNQNFSMNITQINLRITE